LIRLRSELTYKPYKPRLKPPSKLNWRSKLLAGHKISQNKGRHFFSPGELALWEQCQVLNRPGVAVVVEKFIQANRIVCI